MPASVTLKIILRQPPEGVDYALQKGSGNQYETVQKQRTEGSDLVFIFGINTRDMAAEEPNFFNEFVQGPKGGRFIYLDIGTAAGQLDSEWQRRLKIPLSGITKTMIESCINSNQLLQTTVEGTAKDGSPTCATVKPFAGWVLIDK